MFCVRIRDRKPYHLSELLKIYSVYWVSWMNDKVKSVSDWVARDNEQKKHEHKEHANKQLGIEFNCMAFKRILQLPFIGNENMWVAVGGKFFQVGLVFL